MKHSAGVLLYRHVASELEVLLVHPSGNYNRGKPWGIPKGLLDPGETEEQAARRETWEETGVRVGELVSLGSADYTKSKKRVFAFACLAAPDCEPYCASWEIDQALFVTLSVARNCIHPDQAIFLERLEELLRDHPQL